MSYNRTISALTHPLLANSLWANDSDGNYRGCRKKQADRQARLYCRIIRLSGWFSSLPMDTFAWDFES